MQKRDIFLDRLIFSVILFPEHQFLEAQLIVRVWRNHFKVAHMIVRRDEKSILSGINDR